MSNSAVGRLKSRMSVSPFCCSSSILARYEEGSRIQDEGPIRVFFASSLLAGAALCEALQYGDLAYLTGNGGPRATRNTILSFTGAGIQGMKRERERENQR